MRERDGYSVCNYLKHFQTIHAVSQFKHQFQVELFGPSICKVSLILNSADSCNKHFCSSFLSEFECELSE